MSSARRSRAGHVAGQTLSACGESLTLMGIPFHCVPFGATAPGSDRRSEPGLRLAGPVASRIDVASTRPRLADSSACDQALMRPSPSRRRRSGAAWSGPASGRSCRRDARRPRRRRAPSRAGAVGVDMQEGVGAEMLGDADRALPFAGRGRDVQVLGPDADRSWRRISRPARPRSGSSSASR